MVIDDNEEYLRSTARIIEREGHDVVSAPSGRAALEILRKRPVDLVLVDYFMPGMTGEQFVEELRTFDAYGQVILQTGYASERPPREMLKRLDIQGYHDKSEGPDKLLLWVDLGLRAAFTVRLLSKSREGLAYILRATPELHKIQPLEDLLQGVLTQTVGLLGVTDSVLAVAPAPVRGYDREGFLAMVEAGGSLEIRAATGRFVGCNALAGAFSDGELTGLSDALATPSVQPVHGGTVVPLRVGDATLGLIYVEGLIAHDRDRELLTVFGNQAAVAIHNASLYELAAIDQLTRVYTRRFFEDAFVRELRNAQRAASGVALLLVDVDDMKRVNDRGGHLAGDQALAAVGALLRNATRATDIVGRYGGDEFAVVLPGADAAGAEIVVERILKASAGLTVRAADGTLLPVRVTVGGTALTQAASFDARRGRSDAYFRGLVSRLVARADEGLYRGKGAGKARATEVATERWPTVSLPPASAQLAE